MIHILLYIRYITLYSLEIVLYYIIVCKYELLYLISTIYILYNTNKIFNFCFDSRNVSRIFENTITLYTYNHVIIPSINFDRTPYQFRNQFLC